MNDILSALTHRDRAALARAITLIESTREDHQTQAQALLTEALPHTGKSLRIGITGVPGVGKSTFIEAFGMHAIALGHKVAVLAVDPSSSKSGGSILGDKTRMPKLAQEANAFIRPSPTGGSLGGVARRTREAMLLCEAAGYNIIIVETVGVGQSETEVADMADMFMLLLLPGSGDELQGIKRGIVELADLLVVTKADGDLAAQAKRVQADYGAAVKLLTPHGAAWKPEVLACSALENKGIDAVWDKVQAFATHMQSSGQLTSRRAEQAKAWLWKELRERLVERFLNKPGVEEKIKRLETEVAANRMPVAKAVEMVLNA